LANVNSSAIIARQPDVPNRIAILTVTVKGVFGVKTQDDVSAFHEHYNRVYPLCAQFLAAQHFSDKVAGM
jgi:hypothetical protein